MTRLLITGGAGFIGARIARRALADGWQVRVVDTRSRMPAGIDAGRIEYVRGDVTDAATLDAAVAGVDVVSHQAAKVGMGVDIADAPDYMRINALGTAELVAALARAGVSRLVLASSMVVYGEGRYLGLRGDARPRPRADADLRAGMFDPRDAETGDILRPALTEEDAPLEPRSLYAASKLAQENLVAVWARETGGRAALLRYHNVYGPGMPRDTPYAGVAAIFRSSLERGEAPRVFEDGAQRRDFVHVDDIASAGIAAAAWTGTVPDATVRAFNIGSGTISTILDVARVLAHTRGGPAPVVTGEYRAGDVRHITASSARARAELGWTPAIGFAEGMAAFATAPLRSAADD